MSYSLRPKVVADGFGHEESGGFPASMKKAPKRITGRMI